jgi:hypothetical protein
MKARSAALRVFSANGSAMRLDDGAHYREAHSQAFILRSKELVEKPVTSCLGNPRAMIAHGNADSAVAVIIRSNFHDAATWWRIAHGVKGIANEIDHRLLDLNGIAFNGRQICREGHFDFAKVRSGIRLNHMRDRFHQIIQIYPSPNRSTLLNGISDILHDVKGTASICHDIVKNIL